MPRRSCTAVHAALTLLATLLTPPVSSGQVEAEAPPPERSFSESVSVEQVLVPVVVRSGSEFVEGLTVDDFTLWVDGNRTTITSLEHGSKAPVHTVILQDMSGSMGGEPKLAWSWGTITHLLRGRRPGDLYTLATFAADDGVTVLPEPVAERTAVEAWGRTWRPFGRTGIHDAVACIPDLIDADSAWRAAVLLITDGVDNASAITARAAREAARRAEVPVHVIALAGEPEEPWSSDPLKLLSWVTGGRYHSVVDAASVQEASEAFIDELRSQYVLGFPTSGIGQIRPRDIRVEVRGKKRKVSFRREYVGTLPRPPAS